MNIVVDIRCLMDKNRTGVGEYTYGLLSALFSLDKDNQYYLFYNSRQDVSNNIPKWNQDNIHYVYTRWPNKLLNLLLWLKIIKIDRLVIRHLERIRQLAEKSKDLIEVRDSSASFAGAHFAQNDECVWFSPNLNFTHLSKHVKHLQIIHDLSFEFLPECFTWKQRLWHYFLRPRRKCQKADIILTPSRCTKNDVVEKYGIFEEKIKILNPGVVGERGMRNEEQIKQSYNLSEKYILYLGTLEPRKNVESIIEAYKLSAISYQLMVVGSSGWKNKKLLKLIQETAGVKYLGYVTDEEKSVLYQNASLFVFPSLYEGFGLPVLEAMAVGVPVITSNRSSLTEVAGEAGYLIDPHNVAEIAEAMEKILTDEKLRGILVERGLKRVGEFSWQKSAEEFVKLLI